MSRPPRIHFRGAIYHVMTRGNAGMAIFSGPSEMAEFLALVAEVKARSPFDLFAYCLMTNHLHLLIKVYDSLLEHIMHDILGPYAKSFNKRRNRRGHVFEDRHLPILCTNDSYCLCLLRYIHLNPFKAGLVAHPADWKWSSHPAYLGRVEDPLVDLAWPLSLFHEDPIRARTLYEEFVMAGLGLDEPELLEERGPVVTVRAPGPVIVERPEAPRPSLEELAAKAAIDGGIDGPMLFLRTRLDNVVAARRAFIRAAIGVGYRPAPLAHFLGITRSAVCKALAGDER